MKEDDKYWHGYDGLQATKHSILEKYLGGWFPILNRYNGKIIYLDTHAGRGYHDTGHRGSPIIALEQLLKRNDLERMLAKNEIIFVFFEIKKENCEILHEAINNLGPLPRGIRYSIKGCDFRAELTSILDNMDSRWSGLAPCFAFIDPFGFTLDMKLINRLLKQNKAEVFINFMFRYVNMAIENQKDGETALADNLDMLFGSENWREIQQIESTEERAEAIVRFFKSSLEAKYVTYVKMYGANRALKYVLFHATNHSAGRELMIDSIWAACPDGSFSAYERDNPEQLTLITLDPNLKPLKQRLQKEFAGQKVNMDEIYKWHWKTQVFKKKHLHEVIKELKDNNLIEIELFPDKRWGFKNIKEIRFSNGI